uniref:Uncharacterized protein n=1 Tax=viral metagenome TaxID=1070528 RepID=A0A6M3IUU1_9ZZZZ
MIGKKLCTFEDLVAAWESRRSVIGSHGIVMKPRPAAWVMYLSGAIIRDLLNKGLCIYEKEKKQHGYRNTDDGERQGSFAQELPI